MNLRVPDIHEAPKHNFFVLSDIFFKPQCIKNLNFCATCVLCCKVAKEFIKNGFLDALLVHGLKVIEWCSIAESKTLSDK